MQMIVDYIMEEEGRPSVQVVRNGRKRCSIAGIRWNRRIGQWIRKISIAEWIFTEYSDEVQLAEIIHECCHFFSSKENRCLEHGVLFRARQDYWLDQFGLSAVGYKKAYYTHIRTLFGKEIPTREHYLGSIGRRSRQVTPQITVSEFSSVYDTVGKYFFYNGKKYRVTRIESRRPKFPVIALNLSNGRLYPFRAQFVLDAVKKN